MTRNRLIALSVILSAVILGLVYSQFYSPAKGFTYLQPEGLPAAYGDLYFSGQPAPSVFKSLKAGGFAVVINIRGPKEMTFDEKAVAENNGLTYYNLPLLNDGRISDSAVTRIFAAVKDNKGKKILLHCTSGNRVASWFGATLVRDLGYNRKTAITMSRKAGMTRSGTEKTLRVYLENPAISSLPGKE